MERVDDTDIDYDHYAAFYDGKVFTGEVVERDASGTIIGLATYYRGFECGPSREWYPDGRLREEGQVGLSAGAVGTWRQWHPNGELAEERHFDEHGRLLSVRSWDAAGNPDPSTRRS